MVWKSVKKRREKERIQAIPQLNKDVICLILKNLSFTEAHRLCELNKTWYYCMDVVFPCRLRYQLMTEMSNTFFYRQVAMIDTVHKANNEKYRLKIDLEWQQKEHFCAQKTITRLGLELKQAEQRESGYRVTIEKQNFELATAKDIIYKVTGMIPNFDEIKKAKKKSKFDF